MVKDLVEHNPNKRSYRGWMDELRCRLFFDALRHFTCICLICATYLIWVLWMRSLRHDNQPTIVPTWPLIITYLICPLSTSCSTFRRLSMSFTWGMIEDFVLDWASDRVCVRESPSSVSLWTHLSNGLKPDPWPVVEIVDDDDAVEMPLSVSILTSDLIGSKYWLIVIICGVWFNHKSTECELYYFLENWRHRSSWPICGVIAVLWLCFLVAVSWPDNYR